MVSAHKAHVIVPNLLQGILALAGRVLFSGCLFSELVGAEVVFAHPSPAG